MWITGDEKIFVNMDRIEYIDISHDFGDIYILRAWLTSETSIGLCKDSLSECQKKVSDLINASGFPYRKV